MPKFNKQIKKHLLYLLGVLMAFIVSLLGLDIINRRAEADIATYKAEYERQKAQLEEQLRNASSSSCQ